MTCSEIYLRMMFLLNNLMILVGFVKVNVKQKPSRKLAGNVVFLVLDDHQLVCLTLTEA